MFICTKCGHSTAKWVGRCPGCSEWNTLEESAPEQKKAGKLTTSGIGKRTFSLSEFTEASLDPLSRKTLNSKELMNVLWWGIVPGSFILLSGEPWIGKSTLSLQIADWYASATDSCLYVSGEENGDQLAGRAKRLSIKNPHIRILSENIFENILETIEHEDASLIILDSISVFQSISLDSSAGSIGLVRAMAESLMQAAKRLGKSIIVIGHVTKDGSISWPKTLEHLVDAVLFLEGSKYENYRILRSLKNRFGPTDEIGLFRMEETGLQDIQNPGIEFIDQSHTGLSGSALSITMEGTRPLIVEIEALTTYTKFGYPKRSARGIPNGKLDLIIAVLSKFTDIKLESSDVYVNIARGLSLSEPGVDLALIAAIVSSKKNLPLSGKIAIGEVSLTGLVKNVASLERRIDEALKLGFTEIYCSSNAKLKKRTTGTIIPVANVREFIQKLEKI